jgi:hypothetical protein
MSRTDSLIAKLENAGFAGDFVRICLPDWWDEQSESSETAWTQMRLGLAQRLSLDPMTLLDEARPLQMSGVGTPKFKHLALSAVQQAAANGFANGLTRLLLAITPDSEYVLPESALELRHSLLVDGAAPWVGLGELLMVCFAFGVPVAHLTAFPAGIKGMAAMAMSVGDRAAIFTARKPLHPSQVAFYIAHELGHIALGHTRGGKAIVEALSLDPAEVDDETVVSDAEEKEADRFAFELLTGQPTLEVLGPESRGTAAELATTASQTGRALKVDPGLIILCYGRATKRWPTATAALQLLPDHANDVTGQINRALRTQVDAGLLSGEERAYLDAVTAP